MKKSPRGYYIKHYKKARLIMNYSKLFKDFKNELFQTIQYKRLTTGYRIMAAIATFPFWAMYCLILCTKYVYLFMYNCLASSNDYLEIWVKETKQGVQHATEAVIYLVAMPFIFFIRMGGRIMLGIMPRVITQATVVYVSGSVIVWERDMPSAEAALSAAGSS